MEDGTAGCGSLHVVWAIVYAALGAFRFEHDVAGSQVQWFILPGFLIVRADFDCESAAVLEDAGHPRTDSGCDTQPDET